MNKQTHRHFLGQLHQSQSAVCAVAMYLTRLGMNVQINGLHYAPKYDERKQYSDLGDLCVLKRIEVKQYTSDWTSMDDYPFQDALVCSKSSWDNAKEKPLGYIILNRLGTHAMMINHDSKMYWYEKEITDSRRNTTAPTYACPLEFIKFVNLEEILSELRPG